jgi:hypothetical protein
MKERMKSAATRGHLASHIRIENVQICKVFQFEKCSDVKTIQILKCLNSKIVKIYNLFRFIFFIF